MPPTILVVDDEPDLEALIRQRFRRAIRDHELSFLFARNGVDALCTLEKHLDVDVVLTDINMPEMDGLTLLLKLNELKRLLKTVIVSAYGDMENIRLAMNRGAADFLTKPIDFHDLDVTVHKIIEQLLILKEAVKEHDQLQAIRHELDIAASIQQSILPRTFPERADCTIFAAMIPAREVGGDFYDCFLLEGDRVGLVIADVSGKGVPAAIFMAMCRTLLKSTAMQGLSPGECLERVNRLLCVDNHSSMFVTVFYGILNALTGELQYANGGHNPPYVVHRSGEVVRLEGTGGMALGAFEAATYTAKRADLQHGDALLLYTDGVTEAMDSGGNLFSDQRLRRFLAQANGAPPAQIVGDLVRAVREYAGDATQSDDITALALRRT